jgi:hypothetical protein
MPCTSCHSDGVSVPSAAVLAAASATVFNSLGMRHSWIDNPSSLYLSTSPSNISQRSRFFTSALLRVTQPFLDQVLAHIVAPLTTYSESVARTRVFNPSPFQKRKRSAAMTARSSARLLLWIPWSPNGPLPSNRSLQIRSGPKTNAHPARGFV